MFQRSAALNHMEGGGVAGLAFGLGDPNDPLVHDSPVSPSFLENVNLSSTAEPATDERSGDNGLVEAGVKTDMRKRDHPGSSRKKPLKRFCVFVSAWPAFKVNAVIGYESSWQVGVERLGDTTTGASSLSKVLNCVRSQRVIVPAAGDEPIDLVSQQIEWRFVAM